MLGSCVCLCCKDLTAPRSQGQVDVNTIDNFILTLELEESSEGLKKTSAPHSSDSAAALSISYYLLRLNNGFVQSLTEHSRRVDF